jgi:hypothetical protein
MIVSCEMARMSMKMHAYFREKLIIGTGRMDDLAKFIPTFASKRGITENDLDIPKITIEDIGTEFKRFFYFHFSPTLVYRDNYVRSRKIRIKFVLK